MRAPLLSLFSLKKTFSSHRMSIPALKEISLSIFPKEIYALVGESGSGKTTLAKLIVKLFPPTSGDILFEGNSIFSFSPQELLAYRRKVQMIFQDPHFCLDPHMKIFNILEEPLCIHTSLKEKERKEKILHQMEELFLPLSLLEKYPHELSGGQKQRIGILRALVMQPQFVILDEPTSSLDLTTAEHLVSFLQLLHQKKALTSLLITHDLFLAKKMATKIGVLYRGFLVEEAPTEEIFSHPRHPYTQLLLSLLDPSYELQEKDSSMAAEECSKGCHFVSRCPFAFSRCKELLPPLQAINAKSFLRCHFKEK